ncbi:cytidylate kinase-like family protein [Salinactinospora qingdaonensis]|uniref:Cytidylate kinase n=1 Tax=Salinactinospora qingdaonensis TaxID=702744 RepID=A0ABP7FR67_9ACTN
MVYVVTISATYGAGGSVIGPEVAERLGVAFLDRAIPTAVAREIGCSLADALAHDDQAPTGFERLLANAAQLPTITLGSVDAPLVGATDNQGRPLYDREFVEHTERVLRKVGDSGGVILGRAAAMVLSGHPHALHVRFDGPKDRRLRRAVALGETAAGHPHSSEGTWQPPSMRDLEDNDRLRASYVRRFYRADPAHPGHYHLVLDTTVVGIGTCVDVLERLARERARFHNGAQP